MHNFIYKEYLVDNYATVKEMLPQAEVCVYEDDDTHQILGFIGLTGNYIVGIFIKRSCSIKWYGKAVIKLYENV